MDANAAQPEEMNIYQPPEAELKTLKKPDLEATFKTLGFWRKLYLVFIWGVSLFIFAVMAMVSLENEAKSGADSLIVLILMAITLGMTYWSHVAIVKRNISHLTTLSILNLFPAGNVVGCLIMFAIRQTSKTERDNYNIVVPVKSV